MYARQTYEIEKRRKFTSINGTSEGNISYGQCFRENGLKPAWRQDARGKLGFEVRAKCVSSKGNREQKLGFRETLETLIDKQGGRHEGEDRRGGRGRRRTMLRTGRNDDGEKLSLQE